MIEESVAGFFMHIAVMNGVNRLDECWKKVLEFLPREIVAGDAVNFVRDREMKALEVSDVDDRRDGNTRRGIGSIEIGFFLEATRYIARFEADNIVLSLYSKQVYSRQVTRTEEEGNTGANSQGWPAAPTRCG